jgi:hypothetical protein
MTTGAKWVLWIIGVLAVMALALYVWIIAREASVSIKQEAMQETYNSVEALLNQPKTQVPINSLEQALAFAANWEKAREDVSEAQEQGGYSSWTARAQRLETGWVVNWASHGIIPGWVGTFKFSSQGTPLDDKTPIWRWEFLK